VNLYKGSLLKYDVAIFDLPEDQPLPEMKPKKEKVPAYSYLSSHGGIIVRHPDWASCERRVKGQSGAKFKKAMSASDEREILKSWGMDPNKTVIEE
jgi:ribonuclease HI